MYPEESGLLGDLTGNSLCHLQCNSGQDTLSIAKHHHAIVTGIDISDTAIDFAKQLSAASDIPANFERADVTDWCIRADAPRFDVVFVSYGALIWLSDLDAWARGVANILNPGGRIIMVEFHPAIMAFAEGTGWDLEYDYMGGTLIDEDDGVGDYVGEATTVTPSDPTPFLNPHPAKAYSWGIAESIMPLISAGLSIEHFEEYPYSNGWRAHEHLVETDGRRFIMPEGMPNLPMMFSTVARKPS